MPFEGGQGFGTDVVFDAFGIHFGNSFRDAERTQKAHDRFVAALAPAGQIPALIGQENRAVRLGSDKAGFLQANDRAINRDVRDPQPAGEIDYSCFPGFVNQIGNGFNVIFSDLAGMLAPGLRKVLGLRS